MSPPTLAAFLRAQEDGALAWQDAYIRSARAYLSRENPELRAQELLLSILPLGLREEWERDHTVTVQTAKGRSYQIGPGQTRIFEKREEIGRACLQLSISAPLGDRVIAEYLLLKNDEPRYLGTANVAWVCGRIPWNFPGLRWAVAGMAVLDLALLVVCCLRAGSMAPIQIPCFCFNVYSAFRMWHQSRSSNLKFLYVAPLLIAVGALANVFTFVKGLL